MDLFKPKAKPEVHSYTTDEITVGLNTWSKQVSALAQPTRYKKYADLERPTNAYGRNSQAILVAGMAHH